MSAAQSPHILVVDDSTSIRRMITACMESCAFTVSAAEDGAAAQQLAMARTVDLVITDQVMPIMDGMSLIRALRALPAYRTTPSLMLTTEADSSIREQARSAGATGFLPKPFEPERLMQSARQLLSLPAQGSAPLR